MKNHFLFSYSGNKREEVKGIYDLLDLQNTDTIIEPCCGTSAFSYYLSTIHPLKYKYILNDLSTQIFEIYTMLMNKELCLILEQELNKIIDKFNSFDDENERRLYWNIIRQTRKDNIYEYIFQEKYGALQGKMHPPFSRRRQISPLILSNIPIVKFLQTEQIILTNTTDIEVCKLYKDDPTCLIFLDPPYISTSNLGYTNFDMNIYEWLFYNNIRDFKAKVYLILENMWFIKLLFKENHIAKIYDKIYQGSKKNTQHVIISNVINSAN